MQRDDDIFGSIDSGQQSQRVQNQRVQSQGGDEDIFGSPSAQPVQSAQSNQSKRPNTPTTLKAPVEDPGFLKTTLIGAGRTFDNLLNGITQMYLGARGEDAALEGLRKNVEANTAAYQPLAEARPWATGLGEALPYLAVPGGGSAAPAVGNAARMGAAIAPSVLGNAARMGAAIAPSVLGNAARMGIAGALPGALEYGSPEERAMRAGVGGVLGAALPVAGGLLSVGKSVAEPLYQGGRDTIVGRLLNRVAGDQADAVANRLATARQLVPGSAPTAAEVAESGGIAALQRAMASADPEAYAQRAMEQAAARVQALRGIAGDDAALAAAKTARARVAEKMYNDAFAAGVDQDMAAAMKPQIDALLERPSIGKAINEAKDMAAENSLNISDKGSVEGLHYLKMALDDRASKLASKPNKKRLVEQTARDLMSVLEQIAPEYKQATEQYARNSVPINQMQIGQSLYQSMAPALADFGGLARETGNKYALALRNADQTAARATGFPSAKWSNIMSPDQTATLQAIGQDLARKANAQDLGRGVGSNTFQNLVMQNIAEQSGMPRLTGAVMSLPGVGRGINWLASGNEQRLRNQIAETMLNPLQAAELMRRVNRPLSMPVQIGQGALQQVGSRAGLLAAPTVQQSISD